MRHGESGRWTLRLPETHAAITEHPALPSKLVWSDLASLAKAKTPPEQLRAVQAIVRRWEMEAGQTPKPRSQSAAGKAKAKATRGVFKREIHACAADDPTHRLASIFLKPLRTEMAPQLKVTIACSPKDMAPERIASLLAILRENYSQALKALEGEAAATVSSTVKS